MVEAIILMHEELPYIYRRLAQMLQESGDSTLISQAQLEKELARKFRLNSEDIKQVMRELEDFEIVRRLNKHTFNRNR